MTAKDDNRLLFIGFGKLPGYGCFDWDDNSWLNAADYTAVIINNSSLDAYIGQLVELAEENDERRVNALSTLTDLYKKQGRLKAELIKVLFTDRPVYAFATKERNQTFARAQHDYVYVDNYAWSPFHFSTVSQEGEGRTICNGAYTAYASFIKKWTFTFSVSARTDRFEGYSGVPKITHFDEYSITQEGLVTNFSNEPFCVAINCDVLQSRQPPPNSTTGNLTLLHYPQVGNVIDALNSVLKTFTTATVSVDSAPGWINSVKLPAAESIDTEIQAVKAEVYSLTAKLTDLKIDRKRFEKWLTLLYATGEELELVVADALTLLGMQNVERGPKGDWDLSFSHNGRNCVVEVKGLMKGLGRKEVYDLGRHIAEYDTETGTTAENGILIFCPFRNMPITERNPQMWAAGDAINHAEKLEFTLLSTLTLFDMVSAHLTGRGEEVNQDIERLLNTKGLFTKAPSEVITS